MTSRITDEQLDATLRAWATQSVDSAPVETFTVRLSSAPRTRSRVVVPALAAAAVVGLVAAGLVLLRSDPTAPATSTDPPRCPSSYAGVRSQTAQLSSNAESLLPQSVSALTACSYADQGPRRHDLVAAVPVSAELAQDLARHLATDAVDGNDADLCLATTLFSVLVARNSDGEILPTISVIPGCQKVEITNGATTLYLPVRDPAVTAIEERVARARQAPTSTHS